MNQTISFILLIIIALTAFAPCCPSDNCQDEFASSQQQGDKQAPCGTCSPFTSCTSCSGFTITTRVLTTLNPPTSDVEYNSKYLVYHSEVHIPSPWQPPRVI